MNLGTACLFWIFWPGNPLPPRDPTPDIPIDRSVRRGRCRVLGTHRTPGLSEPTDPPREKDPGATLKRTGGQIIFLTVYKREEEKRGGNSRRGKESHVSGVRTALSSPIDHPAAAQGAIRSRQLPATVSLACSSPAATASRALGVEVHCVSA